VCTNITVRFAVESGTLLVAGASRFHLRRLGPGEAHPHEIALETAHAGEFHIRIVKFSFTDPDGRPHRVSGAGWTLNARAAERPDREPDQVRRQPSPRRKVFISYRREDAQELANYLHSELSTAFGADRVFLDRRDRQPGFDFRIRLRAELETSAAMIVLIGPKWNPLLEPQGQLRRIDLKHDHVRHEIRTGLQSGIPVIPVLFRKVEMPKPEELPEEVRELAFREKSVIHETRFEADVQEIVDALRPSVTFR
jgi:hypothetical protein